METCLFVVPDPVVLYLQAQAMNVCLIYHDEGGRCQG